MWGHHGFGGGWMIFGGLVMLLFWVGLIALAGLAFWAFLRYRQPGGPAGPFTSSRKTALDILKERYARGEITREEYEEIRRDLET